MGTLLTDWIALFDENILECTKKEPKELKCAAMLFITIQKEFQRIEMLLNNRLQDIRTTHDKYIVKENPKEEVILIESSTPEEDFPSPSKIKKDSINKTVLTSPVINRRKKAKFKKLIKNNCHGTSSSTPLKVNCLDNDVIKNKNIAPIQLTDEDPDIFESSIIEVTPLVNIQKKSKIGIFSPRKNLHLKSMSGVSTLTQMFNGMKSKEIVGMPTEATSSMLNIDQILEQVESEKFSVPPEVVNLGASSKVTNVCMDSFVQDYDKLPEKLQITPKKPFAFKETVRGNAKKKLKGWSCKSCEEFYKGMNLTEEEIDKKMDECSKHRARYKPDEETIPGFWDMSIPSSPEDQNSSKENMSQESIGNNSTIYGFYK